jgi:hypothetical protein
MIGERRSADDDPSAVRSRRQAPDPAGLQQAPGGGVRSVTTIISILGIVGRAVGRVLTSSLGWASSLLYGRVPKDHQGYVEAMLGASVLWAVLAVIALIPAGLGFVLSTTPFVHSVGADLIRTLLIIGLVGLPLVVGIAGTLVPAPEGRPRGLAIVGSVLRGYPLTLLLAGVGIFLPLATAARRVGSLRRGWSDIHIPIVVKPGGYQPMVDEIEAALRRQDLQLERHRAPRLTELPGRVLALIAGRDVGDLLPDHMIVLRGGDLEVGVYPSDIVISGKPRERLLARAAVMTRLAGGAAHFTTSAESQKVEDRLEVIARPSTPTLDALAEVEAVDRELAGLDVPATDWDTLLRLRLQAERDVLRRA